jgi:hypothetical protein
MLQHEQCSICGMWYKPSLTDVHGSGIGNLIYPGGPSSSSSSLRGCAFETGKTQLFRIQFRWTCDCRLRSFRLWLTQSNVPRIVEPTCMGPRRLLGIHIQSLSLAEFACAPQLSPTSMYLTVPKGKNVSIVCRVASDPVSQITWFFNGEQIHTSRSDEDDDEEARNIVSRFCFQNSPF